MNTLSLADWQRLDARQLHRLLDGYLATRIPGSHLKIQQLPLVPEIRLHLINDDYPRDGLAPEQAAALMDDPPYWGFCWGSGQALARWLLDNPEAVAGRTLIDLGCGSGVVGIAAALAGAAEVILCDLDDRALAASRLNGLLNLVTLKFARGLETLLPATGGEGRHSKTLVAVADVFYDRDNLPLLPLLLDSFGHVLVADSRLGGRPLAGMDILARAESRTVPDLDESAEFSRITLYRPRVDA